MASASERARGIAVLLSWLKAVGVSATIDCGIVSTDKGAFPVDDYDLSLLAINSMEEFHKVTQKLGIGQPIPISRGVAPSSPKELDFDLVAFRHTEYRAAPDLSPEDLKKYSTCITRCIHAFFHQNRALLAIYGMEKADLRTYAIVWTANFCHRYKKDDDLENIKLLTVHLKQRFSGLRDLILNRIGEVSMWGPGHTLPSNSLWSSETESESGLHYWPSSPSAFAPPDSRGPVARRRAAKKAIQKYLDELGPEKATELLRDYAGNVYLHPDVREAATKFLEPLEASAVGQVDEQA